MRRLQPLPQRTSTTTKGGTGTPRIEAAGTPPGDAMSSLKDDLNHMRSEIEGLEREELTQRQTALQLAQERLKQRRRSDLAKRMQEAQRLQVLRERRAELDDTKRDKILNFKKRMIAAAERSIERESQVVDALYQNIGEALMNQDDEVGGGGIWGGDDFADEDSVALPYGDGVELRTTRGTLPALGGDASAVSPGAVTYGGTLRIPSAFEAHWTSEKKGFVDQMKSLKRQHQQPKPALQTMSIEPLNRNHQRDTPYVLSARTPTQLPPISSGLHDADEARVRPATSEHSSATMNEARRERLKVQEELKRLLAQSRGLIDDEGEDDNPTQLAILHSDTTSILPPTITASSPPEELSEEQLVAAVQEIERKEDAHARKEAFMTLSVVPVEDQLVRGRIILETAEANNRRQQELDRQERERKEKEKQSAEGGGGRLGRSNSLFLSATSSAFTTVDLSNVANSRPTAGVGSLSASPSTKARKVSVVIGGEGSIADMQQVSTTATPLIEGSSSAMSPSFGAAVTCTSTPSVGGARKGSIMRGTSAPDAEATTDDNATTGGWISGALGKLTKASEVSMGTLNAADRHIVQMQQLDARFLSRRTAQKEELQQLKRRLAELEAANAPPATATVEKGIVAAVDALQQRHLPLSSQLLPEASQKDDEEDKEQRHSLDDAHMSLSTHSSIDHIAASSLTARQQEASEAATLIQSAFRCHSAKKELVRRRVSRQEHVELEARRLLGDLEPAGCDANDSSLSGGLSHMPLAEAFDRAATSSCAVDGSLSVLEEEANWLRNLASREDLLDEQTELRLLWLREEAASLRSLQLREEIADLQSLWRREDLLDERTHLDNLATAEATLRSEGGGYVASSVFPLMVPVTSDITKDTAEAFVPLVYDSAPAASGMKTPYQLHSPLHSTRPRRFLTKDPQIAAICIQTYIRRHQVQLWFREVKRLRREHLGCVVEAALTIQRWARSLQACKRARCRFDARRRLAARYLPCVVDDTIATSSGAFVRGFGLCAGIAILCLLRRLRTKRVVRCRRRGHEEAGQELVLSEAASSIQREWRRFDATNSQRKSLARSLVVSSAQTAEILNACGWSSVKPRTAVNAVTIIAKYVRRHLLRDELRRRWTEKVLLVALSEAAAIRLEKELQLSNEGEENAPLTPSL